MARLEESTSGGYPHVFSFDRLCCRPKGHRVVLLIGDIEVNSDRELSMSSARTNKTTASQAPRSQSRRPTEIDVRIGQLIRERRLKLSLTQDDLAKALNIAQHQLQKYEAGENRISASRLVECARALQVAITYFYQWTDPHAAGHAAAKGNADETALIETFRDLTAAGRAQLVSIAEVLRGETNKARRRGKRT